MSTGSKTIAELPEVQILDDKDQFVFFQNSTKKTKRITKGNMAISGGGLRGKFIDAASGSDVGLSSATALANAATALSTANGAQGSANGKNKIFYQTSEPTNPINGYTLVINDLWFDTDGGYRMAKWDGSVWVDFGLETQAIANIDAGKITSGFISSQVIELANSSAYFQSSTFVETWVSAKLYKTTKAAPSDIIKVKVLQSDGSFKVYNCNTQHTSSGATFPGPDSGKWTEVSVPTISVDTGNGSTSIPDFGFRIVGNGQAEFGGGLFRGAVIAQEGYFGTTKNAVRIDSDGMQIGASGRIKSSSVSWSGNQTGAFAGNGFFLGYTGGQYQFYVGNVETNFLRWNGTNLSVRGDITATSLTLSGAATGFASSDVGLGNVENLTAQNQAKTGIEATITLASGGIAMGAGGFVRGAINWNTATNNFTVSSSGFFLGYTVATPPTASAYRFFIGETGASGAGGANYLYWDGAVLKIGGNIVGGTTVGTAGDAGAGLTINSTYGIRQGNASNLGVLTITGGNANGIQSGAQIDLCGSSNTVAGGALILQAGSGASSQIRFGTNTVNNTLATQVAVIRAVVQNDGLFEIQRNPGSQASGASGTQFNTNAGNLRVYSNVGIGMAPEETNSTGVTDENVRGKLYVSDQIAIYNNANTPAQTIILNGEDGYATAVRFTTTSSKRFKTKIKNLNLGMETVSKLRPVSFKRKGEGGENDIGLIAEEVEKIIPSIVSKNEKGECIGLDYSKLTVVLIQAVKQLQLEVEKLKNKIK